MVLGDESAGSEQDEKYSRMIEADTITLTERTTRCFSSKTKDQILQASLILFNERSFQTVTTAMIAKHAEVLEGTLWYHFPSKKDILSAHIELLKSLFQEGGKATETNDPKSLIQGVFRSYDVIWDFRYILRDDFGASLKNDPEVLLATQGINAFLDHWTEGRVRHSNQCGVLMLRPESVEPTAELILLIGRYWLDFSSKKYPHASQKILRQKGLTHIFNVLEPHLNQKARDIVLELLNQ